MIYLLFAEHYECIVKCIYNLVYVQACAVISCKFTADERSAWWMKAKQVYSTLNEIRYCMKNICYVIKETNKLFRL